MFFFTGSPRLTSGWRLDELRLDELMPHRLFKPPQRDRLGEPETAARKDGRILVRRALPSPDVDEHLQVRVKNRERLAGILGEVSLHEDDTRAGRHRATAVREDGDRLVVRPVVDDVSQDVGVAADGNRVEEAPSDELAAVDHA